MVRKVIPDLSYEMEVCALLLRQIAKCLCEVNALREGTKRAMCSKDFFAQRVISNEQL